jgi:POT family proton-dependent oligopeptide transporter
MTTADTTAVQKEPTWFGHPRGLTYLFTTEMAERFSYYGMTAILVYYLTQQLLLPGHVEHILGYHGVKGAFEAVVGKLTVTEFATDLAGLYTGLVYLTPFFGGLLADRVTGQRYTVIVGGVLMACGEFLLTQDALFFPGLLMLIIGNGAFKPNISTQVGNLYKPGDTRIDRAYSIFYVGINLGATLAPLICGTLGEKMCTASWMWSQHVCNTLGQSAGWHFGFFAAGVGLSLGVLVYLFALRTLPPDRIARARSGDATAGRSKLTGQDWKAIFALVALCFPITLFWTSYQQQAITIALWVRDFTNRIFIPGVVNFEIPATWSQSINPIMIFAFTPIVIGLWSRQAKRGNEPSTVIKMAIGCFLLAASFVIMAGVAWMTGAHGHASWVWLLAFFAIFTAGELYLSPIGLALVARVAPQQVLSMMMGFWFITSFVGNTLAGYIGSFWDRMDKPEFFLMVAALPAAGSIVIWIFDRPLKPILEKKAEKSELQPGPDIATEENVSA